MSRIIQIQREIGCAQTGVIDRQTLYGFQKKYKLKTKSAVAHFFGNIDHETGGFRIAFESGMYSAKRLLAVFPKYFKTLEEAKRFEYKPEAIFNRTYGGRMGNNTQGDGYKFRGRGAMQTTGKYSYELLSKHVGEDLVKNPDLVATKYYLESAVFYFKTNKLFDTSNVSESEIVRIRRRVNGGINGLDDVRNKVKKYFNLMS